MQEPAAKKTKTEEQFEANSQTEETLSDVHAADTILTVCISTSTSFSKINDIEVSRILPKIERISEF